MALLARDDDDVDDDGGLVLVGNVTPDGVDDHHRRGEHRMYVPRCPAQRAREIEKEGA